MTNETSTGKTVKWAAAALAVAMVPACSMLKKAGAGDAGDGGEGEAAVAVVEAAAEPALAANEADVTRYPDEKATAGSILTTEAPAELRTEVGTGGKLVVVLKKGTEVAKVAEHASHYLVVGEDPKDATRKLMGWAGEGSFGGAGGFHGGNAHMGDGGLAAATDAGHPGPGGGGAPAAGFSCVKQEGGKCPAGFKVSGAVCRMTCKAPADCKGPEPKCNEGLCYASNGCQ